jgi:hypothetical protein
VPPKIVDIGPVPATEQALARAGLTMNYDADRPEDDVRLAPHLLHRTPVYPVAQSSDVQALCNAISTWVFEELKG